MRPGGPKWSLLLGCCKVVVKPGTMQDGVVYCVCGPGVMSFMVVSFIVLWYNKCLEVHYTQRKRFSRCLCLAVAFFCVRLMQ